MIPIIILLYLYLSYLPQEEINHNVTRPYIVDIKGESNAATETYPNPSWFDYQI